MQCNRSLNFMILVAWIVIQAGVVSAQQTIPRSVGSGPEKPPASLTPLLTSPSFDCGKASSPTDKAVCASSVLVNLDLRYAELYRGLRSTDLKDQALREARQYNSDRQKCAGDEVCISREYEKAISQLTSLVNSISSARAEQPLPTPVTNEQATPPPTVDVGEVAKNQGAKGELVAPEESGSANASSAQAVDAWQAPDDIQGMTALAFLIAFLAGVVGGRYAWAFLVLVALGGFYLTKSDFFGYALLALIAYKIYLLPASIAESRGHRHQSLIFWINLLLGFSGIVWLLALVWALSGDSTKDCPVCAEAVQARAKVCIYCAYDFDARQRRVASA